MNSMLNAIECSIKCKFSGKMTFFDAGNYNLSEIGLIFVLIAKKAIGMDPVIILLAIAGLLLIYQIFFFKDKDKLDAHGHEVYAKEKRD